MLGTLSFLSFSALLAGATILTSVGKSVVTNLVSGLGGTIPKWVGWGSGAGTASIGDTDVFTAATESRVSGTVSRTTTTVSNDTYQVQGTLTVAGAPKTITNVGIYDGAGSGSPPTGANLFFHADHSSTSLNVGESITYTLTVQFT